MTQLDTLQLKVDLIISNPPYITPQEKTTMKKNVLNYEPHQALFVPQENPLLHYRHILEYAQKNLKSKGKLYFEINPLFESELETLISSFEYYSLAKREDLFGKVRMFRLEKE
jgi:release factor glutamine methyltransferase